MITERAGKERYNGSEDKIQRAGKAGCKEIEGARKQVTKVYMALKADFKDSKFGYKKLIRRIHMTNRYVTNVYKTGYKELKYMTKMARVYT